MDIPIWKDSILGCPDSKWDVSHTGVGHPKLDYILKSNIMFNLIFYNKIYLYDSNSWLTLVFTGSVSGVTFAVALSTIFTTFADVAIAATFAIAVECSLTTQF